jgi:hypothetical protein
MESAMSEQKLQHYLNSLDAGIDACLKKDLRLPALVLLYSAIESVGALSNDDPNAKTGEIFQNWVKEYLLPVRMIYPNALDLYAARCGIIHTLTPYSTLSDTGKARKVCYASGVCSAEFLQRAINQSGRQDELVAVHIDDLYRGWKVGTERFVQELRNDPARLARVLEKAEDFFSYLSIDSDQNLAFDQSIT